MKKFRLNALIVLICMGYAFQAERAVGQKAKDADIKVTANPAGTMVYLKGEYDVAGEAPYLILHSLRGIYQLKAKKRGYEDYKARYKFKPGLNQRISISLRKKTRVRAFLRSVIIPGWGQHYTDQKVKGYLITSLTVSSFIYLVNRDLKYQKAQDNLAAARVALNNDTGNIGTQGALVADVGYRQTKVNDRYQQRKTALIITSSIYLYNLLDALIFFPKYDSAIGLSLNSNSRGDGIFAGLRLRL